MSHLYVLLVVEWIVESTFLPTDLPFAMAWRSIVFSPTSIYIWVFGLEEFPAFSDLHRLGFADGSQVTYVEGDGLWKGVTVRSRYRSHISYIYINKHPCLVLAPNFGRVVLVSGRRALLLCSKEKVGEHWLLDLPRADSLSSESEEEHSCHSTAASHVRLGILSDDIY